MEKIKVYIAKVVEIGNKQLPSLMVPLLNKRSKSYLLLDQKHNCTHGCDVSLLQ